MNKSLNLVEPNSEMIVEYAMLNQIKVFTQQYLNKNPKSKMIKFFISETEKLMGYYSLKETEDLLRFKNRPLEQGIKDFLEIEFKRAESSLNFVNFTRLFMQFICLFLIIVSNFNIQVLISMIIAQLVFGVFFVYLLIKNRWMMITILNEVFAQSPQTYGKQVPK